MKIKSPLGTAYLLVLLQMLFLFTTAAPFQRKKPTFGLSHNGGDRRGKVADSGVSAKPAPQKDQGRELWAYLSIWLVWIYLCQRITASQQLGHFTVQADLPPGILLHNAGEGKH